MRKEEYVTVKIPKAIADYIQKQPWFKLYHDLDDFTVSGVRRETESWKRTGWTK